MDQLRMHCERDLCSLALLLNIIYFEASFFNFLFPYANLWVMTALILELEHWVFAPAN